MPLPIVALPCGSRSTSSVRWPWRASAAARLTVVVVLPTPPFWFATTKILAICGRLLFWFRALGTGFVGDFRRDRRGLQAALQQQQVAHGGEFGDLQHLDRGHGPRRREGCDFVGWHDPL